jgi:hypothetical protein
VATNSAIDDEKILAKECLMSTALLKKAKSTCCFFSENLGLFSGSSRSVGLSPDCRRIPGDPAGYAYELPSDDCSSRLLKTQMHSLHLQKLKRKQRTQESLVSPYRCS